jgi:putative oxidoreductase
VLLTDGPGYVPTASLCLAMTTFLMLFFGQRVAKDYAGAATIAIYFGVVIGGILLLNSNF